MADEDGGPFEKWTERPVVQGDQNGDSVTYEKNRRTQPKRVEELVNRNLTGFQVETCRRENGPNKRTTGVDRDEQIYGSQTTVVG